MEPTLRLEVDGEVFTVAPRAGRPGQYDYTWISGRDPDYGFSSWRSDGASSTTEEHVEAIRDFLKEINPETGYVD